MDGTSSIRKRRRGADGKEHKWQKKNQSAHQNIREKKRKPRRADEDAEEARIRELVFGKDEGELFKILGAEATEASVDPPPVPFSMGVAAENDATQPDGELLWFEDKTGGDLAIVEAPEGGSAGQADAGTGDAVGDRGDGPAWVDEDDADLRVDISAKNRLRKLRRTKQERKMTGAEFEKRLRSRFTGSNLTTAWAKNAEEDAVRAAEGKESSKKRVGTGYDSSGDEGKEQGVGDSDVDVDVDVDDILRDSGSLKGGRGLGLFPGNLKIVRCKDANQEEPAKSVVQAVSFHPTGELLLAGGFDKTLRLFQVDGVRNSKVHSIFFEDMPISNAVFTANDQAIVTGRRPFFYWYDVPTGKVQKVPRIFSSGREEKHLETFAASPDGKWLAFVGNGGYVLLLSNQTKQWVADFKLNSVKCVTFSPDSKFLLASGYDGDVYKFDIRSRRCVLRFFNEGGTCTTGLAVSASRHHRFSAVGSASGVVNVYDDNAFEAGRGVLRPTPFKALMNLTTPATTVKFNPDGQILAIASSEKRDSLKMVHTRSCSVFANWPSVRTPIRRPYSLDFSPGGGYFAVGNDRGRVLLYRLNYYLQA